MFAIASGEIAVIHQFDARKAAAIAAGKAKHMRRAIAEGIISSRVHFAHQSVIFHGIELGRNFKRYFPFDDHIPARRIAKKRLVIFRRFPKCLGKNRREFIRMLNGFGIDCKFHDKSIGRKDNPIAVADKAALGFDWNFCFILLRRFERKRAMIEHLKLE